MQRIHTLECSARLLAVLMVVLAMIMPAAAAAAPPAAPPTAPAAAPLAQPESGTITGTVFRDYNANGTRESSSAFKEPTLAGVLVTAYDSAGNPQGSTTTTSADPGPNYSLSVSGTGPYRVEFTLPTNGSMNYLKPGAAGATTVQFVPDGNSNNINVGFNNPTDFSQDAPPLITPITFVGSRSSYPTGRNESIVGIDYNASGNLSAPGSHTVYAQISETGTLYGMSYQRTSKLILAGTYMKAYADIGPVQTTGWLAGIDPMGAIYVSRADQPLPNSAVYANLNRIKDPISGLELGNVAGVNPRQNGGNNYASNQCPTTPTAAGDCWNHDPAAWDKVGAIGLGDVEQDDAEQFIFVVNLADKKLYQLPIVANPSQWPIQTLAAPPVLIPNNCKSPSVPGDPDMVPGGLGFEDGKLYVGVTCTAKSTQLASDLKAEVWQYDPVLQTFSATPVLTVPLNYTRGCIWTGVNTTSPAGQFFGTNDAKSKSNTPWTNCQTYIDGSNNDFHNVKWNPWPQTWQQHYTSNKGINAPGKPGWTDQTTQRLLQIEYPHPWLSDIAFDGDDILLGFRDINGDRTGNDVRSPNINAASPPTSGTTVTNDVLDYAYIMDGAGFGDLLRACGSPWVLESNGACGSLTSINGQNRGQGPGPGNVNPNDGSTGWGEFYWDDSGPGSRNPDQALIATWAVEGWGTNPPGTAAVYNAANDGGYSGHEETLKGGLFQRAGAPDIAVTQADQLDSGDGGIARFSQVVDHPLINDPYPGLRNPSRVGTAFGNNEIGIALRHTALYGNALGFFGKANGLGDVEALLEPAPIEIGNRVWRDVNGNGRQDPDEAVLPGVQVQLWADTDGNGVVDTQVGAATTNASGLYYFGGLTNQNLLSVAPKTLTVAVTADSDDAEQTTGGTMSLNDTALDLPYQSTFLRISGMRFQNITIPQGATITGATIQCTSAAAESGNTVNLTIRGQAADNASTFTTATSNISSRPTTTASASWSSIPAWSAGETGPDTTTPALNSIVQEIVNRGGWTSGNAMAFILSNNGSTTSTRRQCAAYENTTYNPAVLTVNFLDQYSMAPDTVYEVRIPNLSTQTALAGNRIPTVANNDADQRDSDGVDIGVADATGVRLTTGGPGENNHTYDFGFYNNDEVLTLGNQVWYDINNNGILDAGEASIDGVKIDLYADSNGDGVLTPGADTLIATTNTAGGGLYTFTNLLPGNYIVHLPQSNFGAGGPLNGMASSTGNNPTPDPDTDINNDDNGYHLPGNGTPAYPGGVASLAVTLSAATEPGPPNTNTNPTVDFGFFGLGAIGNYVWVDENSDGYQDEGEPGIPNVQVNLYDAAGVLVATTYTDSHGGYLFDNLKPGSYFVDIVEATLPAGMSQTPFNLPGADFGNQDQSTGAGDYGYPVTIGGAAPLENLTADFGYNYNPSGDVNTPPNNPGGTPAGAAVAALGDRVWIDSDGQGDQDPNEVGVSGVQVTLYYDPDGNGVYDTTYTVGGYNPIRTTDSNGVYMFDGLLPGAYVVKVTSDVGASHAILTGGQYAQTGDPDHFGTTGPVNDNQTTTPVLLGPGDVFLNADFGYQPSGATLGSIGDTVWFDADADGSGPLLPPVDGGPAVNQGNGLQNDANEYGIPGVTVVLVKDSNGDGVWDPDGADNTPGTADDEPIIAADTTDANGQYLFEDLPIGANADYLVWVNDSDNVLGEMAPTYDKDGAAAPATGFKTGLGISSVLNLAGDVRDHDFGYTNTYQQLNPQNPSQPLGLIGDYVWFDSDRQNDQDEPNAGVEGVLVELLNSTGTQVLATTYTDENGYYSFGGLPLNTSYIVSIPASNFAAGAVLEGMTNTGGPAGGSGNTGPVVNLTTVNPVNMVQDFGYAAPTNAQGSIGNLVWEDLNADGVWQSGEPPIQGVTIDLYRDLNGNGVVDAGEPLMGTQTTDASGNYLFGGLPFGDYVVDVTDVNGVLAGYWHSQGSQNAYSNSGNDAADNSKVDPFAVNIGEGGNPADNLNVDFGYYVKPAAVGNYVWIDSNANGIQDANEPGIDAVTIQMRVEYPDGTIHSVYTVTGDDPSTTAVEHGWYSFGNLLLDEDYSQSSTGGTTQPNQPRYVIVSPPDIITDGGTTYHLTTPNQGASDMVDSDNALGNDETASSATQGRNDVTQNTTAGNESNPNAGYDFGYAIPMDLGDLPDPAYPTTVGSNGARHQLTSALKLGATVDAEYNGQPDAAATGDDNDATVNIASLSGNTGDDEDGVSQAPGAGGGWKEGTVGNSLGGALQVVISGGSGVPQVFMDFTGGGLTGLTLYYDDDNNSGTPLVQYTGSALPAASYRFYFDIPTGACPQGGNAIETRVRLSAAGGLGATGLAPDGEVEDYIFQCSSAPLAVLLATFDATAQADHVLVAWETVSEVSNAGFNLYRSLAADGERTLLTTVPSAAPGSTQGAAYSFQDADVLAGQTYWYWLEDMDLSGATTLHGPVSVAFSAPTAVTLNEVSAGSQGSSLSLLWLAVVAGLAAAALTLRRRTNLR